MLNTAVKTGNVSQDVAIYDSAIISHIAKGSFFIDFEWGSRISYALMGDNPRYNGEKVEIIQMRTMIGERGYRDAVSRFKAKWFGGSREERLKGYVDDRIERTRRELYALIGVDGS